MSDRGTGDDWDPEAADAATLRARAVEADDPERKRELLERAVDRDDAGADTHYRYGRVLHRAFDDEAAARAAIDRALDHDPEHPGARNARTVTLLRTDEIGPAAARSRFESILDDAPNYVQPRINLAHTLWDELDEPEAAREHYERAVETDPAAAWEPDPEFAWAQNDLANLLKNEFDEPEAAREQYERALEADPEYAMAHNNYANLLKNEFDEPEAAREQYERALEADPERASAHYSLAELLNTAFDDRAAAADHYERAVAATPDRAKYRIAYAIAALKDRDDPDLAREQFERAVEVAEPGSSRAAEAHGGLAEVLEEEFEEYGAARDHYERAVEIAPDEPMYHHYFGTFLEDAVDEPAAAREQYERAADLDPEFDAPRERLDDLSGDR